MDAAELEPGSGVGDAEAHLGGLGGDAELAEQRDESGIIAFVVDDETGVDCVLLTVDRDVHGVRVAADSRVGLEHGDVVVGMQEMGGDEPRHTGPDHGDLHLVLPGWLSTPVLRSCSAFGCVTPVTAFVRSPSWSCRPFVPRAVATPGDEVTERPPAHRRYGERVIEPGDLTRWLTPEVSSLNRLPPGAPFDPYDSVGDARRGEPSPWVRSLDGQWRFALVAGPDAVTADHIAGPADDWSEIAVPGSWVLQGFGAPIYLNVEMPFALHAPDVPADNPTGVYRRTFRVPTAWRKRRTILRIGSADSLALVWVNGVFIGLGKDSRLPSSFDVTDALRRGANDLTVVVPRWSDASWIEDQDQWWLPGLHRSVELVSVPTAAISDAGLVPGLESDNTTGTLTVDVSVDAPRDHADLTVEVVVEGDRRRVVGRLPRTTVPRFDDEHATLSAYIWPGDRVRAEIRLPGIEPWSHEHPRRYRAFVVLRDGNDVLDVRTTHVGFRRVEVADGALLVNGEPVVINGVNRHENHPDTGRVVSRDDMRRDLELMKQHHVNAVRTAHYPDGEAFYDLCDELGLYVVDEANVEAHARCNSLAWDTGLPARDRRARGAHGAARPIAPVRDRVVARQRGRRRSRP